MIVGLALTVVILVALVGVAVFMRRPRPPEVVEDEDPYIDPETDQLIILISDMEALAPKARDAAESGQCPAGCEKVEVDKKIDTVRWWIAHLRHEHGYGAEFHDYTSEY